MELIQSRNETGIFRWFTFERRNWLAICVAAALSGFWGGNGHTTQGAIEHVSGQLGQTKAALNIVVSKDIPALKAEAGCEHWRADTAAALAVQSQAVSPDQLPKDCPHPKIVVPSAPSAAAKK